MVLDSLLSNGHSLHHVYPRIPANWPEELEVRERPAGSPNPFQLAARDPHTVRLISNHGQNRAIRSTKPFPDLPKRHDDLDDDSMWCRLTRLFRCKARLPLATMPALPEVMGFPRPLAQIEEADVASEPFSMPWRREDASLDLAPRFVAYYEVRPPLEHFLEIQMLFHPPSDRFCLDEEVILWLRLMSREVSGGLERQRRNVRWVVSCGETKIRLTFFFLEMVAGDDLRVRGPGGGVQRLRGRGPRPAGVPSRGLHAGLGLDQLCLPLRRRRHLPRHGHQGMYMMEDSMMVTEFL